MEYKPRQMLQYMGDLYGRTLSKIHDFFNPSGLELAIAGVPNGFLKTSPKTGEGIYGHLLEPINQVRHYFLGKKRGNGGNIAGYEPLGSGVVEVTRGDGKIVRIDLSVYKHGPEGKARHHLRNNGIDPDSSTLKRIVKAAKKGKKY